MSKPVVRQIRGMWMVEAPLAETGIFCGINSMWFGHTPRAAWANYQLYRNVVTDERHK